MKNLVKIVMLSVFSAGVACPSFAQDGTGNVGNLDCKGGPIEISGEGNYYRINGYCTNIEVNGTGNVVVVDRVGQIEVNGTGNLVQYIELNLSKKKPVRKIHPGRNISGTGNIVQWTKGSIPESPM